MRPPEFASTQSLDVDLEKLRSRAYHFADWAEEVLRRYHAVIADAHEEAAASLRVLHRWMFVPPTLWPFNIRDVLADCLGAVEKNRRLSKRQGLLIDLLPQPPDENVCRAVAAHEHQVQTGSYEHLVRSPAKYAQNELAVSADPELRRQWDLIKSEFDVRAFADRKGVIRRSMGAERNLRPGFYITPKRTGEMFQAAFDAFCLRWNLYGMQGDEPLLLKLAVNVTPYGTMIVIPAYWSFDPKRDLRWDAVSKLHRARVSGRQGSALAEGYAKRRQLAAKLRQLDAEARRLRLKGQGKHEFLCKGLGWVPGTSPRRISRLRAEFKK